MLRINGGERLAPPEVLATPSISLNHAIGGGIWTDKITCFWGNPMSGKTTFALHLMGSAEEAGYIPVIIDSEGSYTDEWAERCSLSLKNRIYIRSGIVEEISKEICPMMQKRERKYIFLVDSISGLIFEAANKDDEGGKAIGGHARAQKWLTNKINSYIHPGCAVIYVAQQSVGMNQMGGYLKANYGNAVEHYSTNVIKLFTSTAKDSIERDKDTNRILGQKVTWTVIKCRQTGAEGTQGFYWFNKQTAEIEKNQEIIHIAKRVGIITGTTWPEYQGQKYHGMAKLMEALTDEDYAKMEDTIMSLSDLGGEEVDE